MDFKITDRFFIDFEDHTKLAAPLFQASDGNGISSSFERRRRQRRRGEGMGKQHGNALHHIAYAVDDIKAEVAEMKRKGIPFTTDDFRERGAASNFYKTCSGNRCHP
jgi:4-hydroxyphenylpyruvate dioxygenase-like putative hemolysin